MHFGYAPRVYYPKPSKGDLFRRLVMQLKDLDVPFVGPVPFSDDSPDASARGSEDPTSGGASDGSDDSFEAALRSAHLAVDGIFGFSFHGSVREPFPAAISALASSQVPVLAVDAPSSWDIETGPPSDGPGKGYMPDALISLTAPKPLVKWFTKGRHFVGGRFLSRDVARMFGIDVPEYRGVGQVVEVSVGEGKL